MIIAIGDIHSDFKGLGKKIVDLDIRDCTLIQVGDFGAGFGSWTSFYWDLKKLNAVLVNSNCNLLVIRGNHDDPVFWSTQRQQRFNFSNIDWVGDYTFRKIEDRMFCFVGGAISIDRKDRIPGKTLFAYEQVSDFTKYRSKIKFPEEPIDVLITHDVSHYRSDPTFLANKFVTDDQSLLKDLLITQQRLDDWYLEITKHNTTLSKKGIKWFHGHYHRYYSYHNTYGDHVVGCGINDFIEIR